MNSKTNLLDFDSQKIEKYFADLGEKPFRARQVFKWIHQAGCADFQEMTNISKSLRTDLGNVAEIRVPEIIHSHRSSDGTHKWLLRLSCGNSIETVYIPERKRGTLCVS